MVSSRTVVEGRDERSLSEGGSMLALGVVAGVAFCLGRSSKIEPASDDEAGVGSSLMPLFVGEVRPLR